MESPSRSSPIAFSGAFAGAGEDASLVPDPNSGSAAGSLQGASDGPLASRDEAAEFGFQRAEFGRDTLVGTVQAYDRHVFLCYKSPEVWPAHVEAAESDRLLRLLAASLKARKEDMKKRTRLTICEGEDGTDSSNGDVLIFPDMIRYRRLTHFDADNFVEEVLVKDTEWPPGTAETLTGSYVFVCAHGSRDRRCGVCGPVLIEKFKEEINIRGLQGQVFVSACSHIGGHKYAGNVIIFSPTINGEVTGHWYGYVAPDDVAVLLEQHIGRGKIIDHLWRGQMGLSEEDQKKAQNLRPQLNGGLEQTTGTGGVNSGAANGAGGCCQGVKNTTCCQAMPMKDETEDIHIEKQEIREIEQKAASKENKVTGSKGAYGTRKICAMPTWFESWEREDTYAALAVVAAVASVAVAYSYYRHLK